MDRIRAVVFDLDGTLVDSLADIAAAVNTTLLAHGRDPHPLPSFRTMVGWGLRNLLETATTGRPFTTEEFETVYAELLAGYRARPVTETRPYPGVEPLFSSLTGRVPLGVFSNKEDGMTKTIVAALFPGAPFQTVVGARPGRPHKPDPAVLLEILEEWGVEPGACAYLGDSAVDIETAQAAGAEACGAAWGFRDAAELKQAGAREVFADAAGFARWLEPRLSPTGQSLPAGGN